MININSVDEIELVVKENLFAFFYISTPDCNVCKTLLPKIEKMLKKFPEIINRYIDADNIKEVAGYLSVFTVPTMILFIDGKETIRKARNLSIAEMENEIERYYKMLI